MKFPFVYRGEVIDNNDLDQLGRVKVKVFPLFSGIGIDQIPWAIPAMPLSTGAGIGYGSFHVPDIGSLVYIFFEAGDVYQPIYFAEAPSGKHGLPDGRVVNYPLRRIDKTKNGIEIYIDDTPGKQEIKVTLPSGTYFKIDNSGNVILNSVVDITIKGNTVHINPF